MFYTIASPAVHITPSCRKKENEPFTVRFHVVLIVYELVFHCLHGLYAKTRQPRNIPDAIATFQ